MPSYQIPIWRSTGRKTKHIHFPSCNAILFSSKLFDFSFSISLYSIMYLYFLCVFVYSPSIYYYYAVSSTYISQMFPTLDYSLYFEAIGVILSSIFTRIELQCGFRSFWIWVKILTQWISCLKIKSVENHDFSGSTPRLVPVELVEQAALDASLASI